MIKTLFPPGAYGHFFAKCLHGFTDLCRSSDENFLFDNNGSSHDIRYALHETELSSLLKVEHLDTYQSESGDRVVIILPLPNRCLDYYDNQFFKQEKASVIRSILTQVSLDDADQKLKHQWNYHSGLDNHTPRWIIREWFSFFLISVWGQAYDSSPYQALPHVYQITSDDLFNNLYDVVEQSARALGLNIKTNREFINYQQQRFALSQQFHGRQDQCDAWCNCVINNQSSNLVNLTIFDEAYIQHKLRCLGYEIQCDGLESWPVCARELHKLIYNKQ